MRSRRLLRLGALVCAALTASLAGCGGAGRSRLVFVETAWDRPVRPPPTEMGTMFWAVGAVTSVSADGSALTIEMKRGALHVGARVALYVPVPEKPGAHYMWDEARELKVGEANVVAVAGDRCEAELVEGTTNAPVSAGDRIIIGIP